MYAEQCLGLRCMSVAVIYSLAQVGSGLVQFTSFSFPRPFAKTGELGCMHTSLADQAHHTHMSVCIFTHTA